MDSGCSKHMTGGTKNFPSFKALQGWGVTFGDGKKRYILGVGEVGKTLEESIENVYHVSGLSIVFWVCIKFVTREMKWSSHLKSVL